MKFLLVLVPRGCMGNPQGHPVMVCFMHGASRSGLLKACGITKNGKNLFFRSRRVELWDDNPVTVEAVGDIKLPMAKNLEHVLALIEQIEADMSAPPECPFQYLPSNRMKKFFREMEK